MWQWMFCAAVVWQVWQGNHWFYWLLPLFLLPFYWCLPRPKYLYAGCALVMGGLWASLQVQNTLAMWLPEKYMGESLLLQGEVEPFSWREGRTHYGAVRYGFVLNAVFKAGEKQFSGKVRLAYYPAAEEVIKPFKGGERVQVEARLKPPNGTVNEGVLSRVQLDFARGIIAQGTVRTIKSREPPQLGLALWREKISAELRDKLNSWPRAQRLVPALVVADKRHLTEQEWQRYRESGTAHLLAISGLHVSLVAGFAWLFGRWVLLLLPFVKGVAQVYAVWPALLAALIYAALAGFSLPTQRALIMCAAMMLYFARGQAVGVFTCFRYACFAVLLWAPLSVVDPSFWLSFGAVLALLVLFFVGQRVTWWRTQLMLSFGVGALGAWWFGSWGLLSPLANWVLIPLFAWCLVPMSLLMVLGLPAKWLAPVLEVGIWLSEKWLLWLEPWQWQLQGARSFLALIGLVLVALVVFLPRLPFAPWVLISWLLPWLWPSAQAPDVGGFDYITLDVGQGQASVIRTQNHLLLYDTGPTWGAGNAGESILIPWLQQQSQTLGLGVISHGDSDHSGGAKAVRNKWPKLEWLTSEPDLFQGAQACWRGQSWQWDGVDFHVLWPPAGLKLKERNNASCVIKVSGAYGEVLLTGDIHRPVEFWLTRHEKFNQGIVLQVPHHGSATSSSYAWIKALKPSYAIVSNGYANPFNHPNKHVEKGYKALNVTLLTTAESGMIVFLMRDHHNSPPIQWRYAYPRSWYLINK